MADIWKITAFIFILAGTLLLSIARPFAPFGVAPDLVLLLFGLFFFRTACGGRLKASEALFLAGSFVLFSAVLIRFWLPEAVVLAAVIALVHFSGRRITGEAFLDLMLSLAAGTLVFYAASALLFHRAFLPLVAGTDFLLMAAMSAILWWPIGWLGRTAAR
ncbi:hypothetical protein M1432_01595 [Patescibacteria group bacterium]|nr:hypothetical protein [Patescibacteria group bacterium]